ncbi:hypothetical protein PHET_00005 [Paragonimus heterotremus]|uniref:PDZ domain-containing protein n=1 Tax=Paragonimus heterotremus TaxID=100268 RepID=A0A8J4TQV5_9TREM|nr:hypothetical protein PHET_00005 [Paragonimus heterotremus]
MPLVTGFLEVPELLMGSKKGNHFFKHSHKISFSRVSRLRDMFQTGIIRPIEEIDNDPPFQEPSVVNWSGDHARFLRSFPGSPPLSALRAHRNTGAIRGQSTAFKSTNVPVGRIRPGYTSTSDSPSQTPPARPPKPRHLSLENVSPCKSPKPTTPEAAGSLNDSNKLLENSTCHVNEEKTASKPPMDSTVCSAKIPVEETKAPATWKLTNREDSCVSKQSMAVITRSTGSSNPPAPDDQSQAVLMPTPVCSEPQPVESDTYIPCGESTRAKSPVLPSVAENENNASVVPCGPPVLPLGLSSWQCYPALNQITSSTNDNPGYQDFVVQSDAFRVSPNHGSKSNAIDDSFPTLQHAEPIAVATPDEDEESEEEEVAHYLPSIAPTLNAPAGLKVVTVDGQGVHILEDGNFFYTVPGLSSHPESPTDLSFLESRPHNVLNHSKDRPSLESCPNTSATSELNRSTEMTLPDSSTDSISKRVRFSTEPIMIYSTHSTLEYNRRNDEIDPLAASAEYELEKHLEEMELINVDLQKGPQGLGISILGLGVDNVGGDQKLGIFIKALTPGGAAEANGQIQVYDQIVTVDGVSLVGVSQQFAAQTLRNTHDVVHFVLAREHDPANSRVAQLLAEQEDESRPSNSALPSAAEWKRASTNLGDSLVRDDSVETLHKLLADAEQAVQEAVDSFSEDELGPEEDEEELEIVDTSPMDHLGHNSDWINCGVSERITCAESPQKNAGDLSGPRSVLKGTATAASTKRRRDAITHLIRLVEQRAKAASSSDLSSVSQSADSEVDNVRWILASDLYDCHTQLIRLQTQLRSLEQRLTAQEAAADEAIERLCRQCRHVELELNESRERLKQYIEHQTQQQQPQSPSLTKQSPSKNPHLNGLPMSPGTSSNSVPTSSLSNDLVPLLNPSIWSSNFLGSAPGTLTAPLQDSSCGDWLAAHSSSKTVPDSCQSELSPTRSVHSQEATTMTACSDSPTMPVRQHSRSSQDRTRLVSSGGLAQRRPPTRITINPPPSLVPNAEALLLQFTQRTGASSMSSSLANSSVNERQANHRNHGPASFPVVRSHTPSSLPVPPIGITQSTVSHCLTVCSEASIVDVTTSDKSSQSYKLLGVHLPALSGGPALLRHRTDTACPILHLSKLLNGTFRFSEQVYRRTTIPVTNLLVCLLRM